MSRLVDGADILAAALEQALGHRIREDEMFACDVWSALCNTDWIAPDGQRYLESFRTAGGVISEIRQDGSDYLTWYCSTPAAVVTQEISDAMAAIGWRHEPTQIESPGALRERWAGLRDVWRNARA